MESVFALSTVFKFKKKKNSHETIWSNNTENKPTKKNQSLVLAHLFILTINYTMIIYI